MVSFDIPISWPLFPILPLFNQRTGQLGVLLDLIVFYKRKEFSNKYVVFLCNMLEFGNYTSLDDFLGKVPRVTYDTLLELEKQGWVPG